MLTIVAVARRERGITLIELMVTIAVLALLMMAIIPEIGSWSRNMQIRDTAESFLSGLQRARQTAVTLNRPVTFTLVTTTDAAVLDNSCTASGAGRSWVVSIDDPERACAANPSATDAPRIVAKAAGGAGGRVATAVATNAAGEAATSVTFDAYGRVQAGTTPIRDIVVNNTYTDDSKRKLQIEVTAAGGIRLCDPSASVGTTDPRRCTNPKN